MDLQPAMGKQTLPCNIRMYPAQVWLALLGRQITSCCCLTPTPRSITIPISIIITVAIATPQEGRAIVPDLSGPVAVLDNANEVISVVNVSVLLAGSFSGSPLGVSV